jgi:hypothetical protein
MPVETQKGSVLPHVSPSDTMPIPNADAALKRRGQTRGSTAILTSSPYFKELRDKTTQPCIQINDMFLRRDSCLENVERNQRSGWGSPFQTRRHRMKGMRHTRFVTSCFPHQNPEKSGLNAQGAINGHTYIALLMTKNRKCVYVRLLQRMWHIITSVWHLFFDLCFDTWCDSWCVCVIYITLVLRCESGPFIATLFL